MRFCLVLIASSLSVSNPFAFTARLHSTMRPSTRSYVLTSDEELEAAIDRQVSWIYMICKFGSWYCVV